MAPGEESETQGSVRLDGRQARQLTVRLLLGERELDSRSVTVTPTEKRSLSDRFSDWVADNAILLVALLVALILTMAGLFAVIIIRQRPK